MASSPESASLISVRHCLADKNSNTTHKLIKGKDVRDYDSLNNLMYLESDCESILNESKIDFQCVDRDSDSVSVSTKVSLGAQCCYTDCKPDACASNRKLMFKEELDKHRSLVKRDLRDGTRDTENNYKLNSKKSIWRSFLSLCVGLLFAFMSFMPLRNIQTSLYPLKHLGNVSLACMYFCFAIGCLFSSWITQNARPKGVLLVALFGHVMYCAANIYPSMYSLIPSACFFGFFHAPMWSAQELMIASYGASYTAVTYINIDKSIQQFQGVFLIFCHAAQVFGNLIESAILHCGDYNDFASGNHSLVAMESSRYNAPIKIDNITEESSNNLVWIGPFGYRIYPDMTFPGDKTNYENIVKFVFVAFAVMGMTIICLFLNKPDIIIHKKKVDFAERLQEVGRFLPTATFLSLFLLMLFTGMQQAVVIGSVTKVCT